MGLHRGADPTRMGEIAATGGVFPEWTDCLQAMARLTDVEKGCVGYHVAEHLLTAEERAAFNNHLWLALIHFDDKHRTYGDKPHNSERQAAIVRAARDEANAPKTCRTCYRSRKTGMVQLYVEGKGVLDQACPRCNGTGWTAWSDKKRAKATLIHNESWARFEPGYEMVLRECSRTYKAASDKFMRVLFGDDSIVAA